MFVRGTRLIEGRELEVMTAVTTALRGVVTAAGYAEVVVPALAPVDVFRDKVGDELGGQMWTFRDKGDREVCLIPEVTGVLQRVYRDDWAKARPKPVRVFYLARCYRYERPQAGRYREFWQFGVENLSADPARYAPEVRDLLTAALAAVGVPVEYRDNVRRGLGYYVGGGFEAAVPALGAQSQVAGGGAYAEGVGWAIGVDRLVLAKMTTEDRDGLPT